MAEAALVTVIQELKNSQAAMQQQIALQQQSMESTRLQLEVQTELIRQSTVQHTQALERDMQYKHKHSTVDTRVIGKPDKFNGKESEWVGWKYAFCTWIAVQYDNGKAILDWAEEHISTEITDDEKVDAVSRFPKIAEVDIQLHTILVTLNDRKTAGFEIVRNTPRNSGLDAWRRLNKRYDPNNPQSNMHLLRKVMRPKPAALGALLTAIEDWESLYRVYQDKTGEHLSDAMQRMCLHAMVPNDLLEHLELETIRLDTFAKTKLEIERYLEAKSSRESGANHMDIGEFSRKGKGKGKGKKGGQGGAFEGNCNRCGKKGH